MVNININKIVNLNVTIYDVILLAVILNEIITRDT